MSVFLWILGLLGLIGGIGLVIASRVIPKEVKSYGDVTDNTKLKRSLGRQGPIYALLGIAVIVLVNSFVIMPTGKVGAVYQFGVLQKDYGVINSGTVYWHTPFIQTVKQISIMQENSNEASDADAKIWGESKDKLPVYCRDVRITYQIEANGVMYLLENVVDMSELSTWGKTVQSAFAASTVQFDDVDVCKQSLIEPVMLSEIQRITDSKYGKTVDGVSNVNVVRVLIGELDYEQAYQDAITRRKNAEQAATEQAILNQQNIDKVTSEGEAKKIAANADKEAKQIAADADAYEILKLASAQAEANEKLAASLSDMIIANEWIIKWNGQMPYVVDGGGNIIDITGILNQAAANADASGE